ncbi:hypothetical protein BKA70DRAFT_123214 [Coprinopsis sp. MPI-PUGE-AT-0042]|nr:hypothetical protein BKA70DRAFT_123214 [Coprinopsis sp. MPI-PUGE-AT-0042]
MTSLAKWTRRLAGGDIIVHFERPLTLLSRQPPPYLFPLCPLLKSGSAVNDHGADTARSGALRWSLSSQKARCQAEEGLLYGRHDSERYRQRGRYARGLRKAQLLYYWSCDVQSALLLSCHTSTDGQRRRTLALRCLALRYEPSGAWQMQQ